VNHCPRAPPLDLSKAKTPGPDPLLVHLAASIVDVLAHLSVHLKVVVVQSGTCEALRCLAMLVAMH
jgi:hypothetical protein